MKASEYEKMYRAETAFWWFAGKGALINSWVGKWLPEAGEYFDVGCGTGANLDRVRGRGRWMGVDPSAEAVGFCAARGVRSLVRSPAESIPFRDKSFDGASALDIFEHVPDDAAAAREIFRTLKPGGILLATVPAHPFLWSAHDEAMGHVRRYGREDFKRLLSDAGFEIIKLTHFMGFLFPAMLPVRVLQKFAGNRSETISYEWPRFLNKFLLLVVELEVRYIERFTLPFGTTLACVARRPGKD